MNKELRILQKAMAKMVKAQMMMLRELDENDLISIGAVEDIRENLKEAYRILKELEKSLNENRD